MKSSKIVLIQPPIQDFYLTKKRTLPYGLASIAACLENKGFEVQILDALATEKSKAIEWPDEFSYLKPFYGQKDTSLFSLFHEFRHFGYSYEHIGTKIREIKPFVVGISSLFTPYGNEALETAKAVKRFYPECKIVLGGHHPTQFPEEVLASPAVDFVLRGEGETGMALLCEALRDGSDVKQIPGIAFKKETGTGIFISSPFWSPDLGALPLPASHLMDQNFYQRKNKGSIMVVSSRGCPMGCSYCSVSASSDHGPFRRRPVEDVIQEIQIQIENNDIGFIDFEDENLCLNRAWFLRLFAGISRLTGGRDIEFRAMNGLYPPSLDEKIVSRMKAAGFKTLNLSLGSTDSSQLKRFQRPNVRDAFEKALDLAQAHDLGCVSYIIAAAPGQTACSSLRDLLYLARKRTLVGLSIYYPAPGSLDFQVCRDKNILPEHFCLMRSTALPVEDVTSRIQAVTLLRLSRILNFMKHPSNTHLPEPEPFPGSDTDLPLDRQGLSKRLLQWFLYDGIVRGAGPDGDIFNHVTDVALTRQFIEQIKTIPIKGVK